MYGEENKKKCVWKKGLIVKLLKKGDLAECRNLRVITFLPIASKVLG